LVVLSVLLILFTGPSVMTAQAHTASTFTVLVQENGFSQNSPMIIQNDSIIWHNTDDVSNLTHRLVYDHDGDGLYNGTHDVVCNLNGSEYCSFWLDPQNWTAGQWQIEIIEENGTTMYASVTVKADIHVMGNPIGYQFGIDDDEEIEVEAESTELSQNSLMLIAATSGLGGLLLLVTLMNNRNAPSWREEE